MTKENRVVSSNDEIITNEDNRAKKLQKEFLIVKKKLKFLRRANEELKKGLI